MKLIGSSLKGIEELIKGYDTENIVSLYSQAGVGKTLMLIQEAYFLAKETKQKVLYLDTEGGTNRFIMEWGKNFIDKYKVKENDVIVKCIRRVDEILNFHGIDIVMDVSKKGGRTTVKKIAEKKYEDTPIIKLIRKEKIGTIIYDSITAPFREFGSTTQNLPARADAEGYLFSSILGIIDKEKVRVITTNHASMNPQNPFATASIRGGDTIKYFSKIILYMERFRGKRLADYRKLHIVRYFNEPSWVRKVFLHYTGDGVFDCGEDEIAGVMEEKKDKKEKGEVEE